MFKKTHNMFPTGGDSALGVTLCEAGSFDLIILGLFHSAILTHSSSLGK